MECAHMVYPLHVCLVQYPLHVCQLTNTKPACLLMLWHANFGTAEQVEIEYHLEIDDHGKCHTSVTACLACTLGLQADSLYGGLTHDRLNTFVSDSRLQVTWKLLRLCICLWPQAVGFYRQPPAVTYPKRPSRALPGLWCSLASIRLWSCRLAPKTSSLHPQV